uniref:Uncharacterized protein n=1 Tax=Rhizophagus irregularis (strain DAOM 181602 / DAOM 197198 / MUCL 43194) TaxID=747089 RepID=U9U0I7_RHIID
MFKYLGEVVENYNISGNGKAVLQEFDAEVRKSFILCIVTGLMYCIHETVLQASKICYMDASTLFEPLNTLITLLYTSCTTVEFVKTILPPCAFYGCRAQIGPVIFFTDDLMLNETH